MYLQLSNASLMFLEKSKSKSSMGKAWVVNELNQNFICSCFRSDSLRSGFDGNFSVNVLSSFTHLNTKKKNVRNLYRCSVTVDNHLVLGQERFSFSWATGKGLVKSSIHMISEYNRGIVVRPFSVFASGS